jgi:basic amino acid/polyamine antiporter, APA family
MPLPPASDESSLVRAIGVRGLTANIINTTVGAGIFVLPAIVAQDLGGAAPLAYMACAFAMTLVVATFAMAGSRVSLTGGIYAYVETAFGPFLGFLSGLLIWFSCFLAAGSVASALTASAALVVPAIGTLWGKILFISLVYAGFVLVNVRGVALGTRLVEIVTLAKLFPLVLLVSAGLFWVRPANLVFTLAAPAQIGAASLTLIFAFVGVEVALVPSGEVRDPARTVPRAVFIALGITTLIYLLLQLVASAVLGQSLAQFVDAPLAEAAGRVLGGWARNLMLAGAAVSMLGFLSGDMLGTPRSLFAFARDGLLPGRLARLHPSHHTPSAAIVTYAVCAVVAANIGSFGVLALLSNVALLSAYVLCCAAAIQLTRKDVRCGGTPFRVPGGPLVPAVACCVEVWLLAQASRQELAVTAVTITAASLLYGLRRIRAARQIVTGAPRG